MKVSCFSNKISRSLMPVFAGLIIWGFGLLLSGCNKESKREVAGDNVIDISELDDDQLGRCLGDSLFTDTTDVFKTIALFEIDIPRPVDSILRNYVIPEMKANGCDKYKLIDIMYANDYLSFSVITPDEHREMGYESYGYNDDYGYGLVVDNFEKNKLRAKKSDRKKTVEIKDYTNRISPPFDPPVCYFDPNNDFELIYPLNLY